MNVLVLIPSLYGTSPGTRFRIEQWAPALERQGFRFTFASFEDEKLHSVIYQKGKYFRKTFLMARSIGRRFAAVSAAARHDVVFLFEEAARVGPPLLEQLIRRTGTPIVYDFCDPIFVPYVSPINRYLSYLKCFSKYSKICALSDHVTVGNRLLYDFARKHNESVSVVPITIDTEHYAPAQRPGPGPSCVVGWSGSRTTVPHLESIGGALRRISRRSALEFRVIGNNPPDITGVDARFVPWRPVSEVADLQQLDIGIMPLPNDQWTRLRSHLKVRQYMGVGVPVVASPVGIMAELIQDGVNGFLASTEDEWVEKVGRLADDPGLRREMGRAGRQTIEDRYSARVWVPRFREILEAVVDGRRGRRSGA
jgi:glycosyltransferase involved in cell wall biosynthesis